MPKRHSDVGYGAGYVCMMSMSFKITFYIDPFTLLWIAYYAINVFLRIFIYNAVIIIQNFMWNLINVCVNQAVLHADFLRIFMYFVRNDE